MSDKSVLMSDKNVLISDKMSIFPTKISHYYTGGEQRPEGQPKLRVFIMDSFFVIGW